MKFLPILILAASCNTKQVNEHTAVSEDRIMQQKVIPQKSPDKEVLSTHGTYTLKYSLKESAASPVKIIEYLVVETKTGKVVKPLEKLAADKIYWRDDSSLIIVPYTEVAKHQDLGAADTDTNEIIIKIK